MDPVVQTASSTPAGYAQPAPLTVEPAADRQRIDSVDLLRGIVMVIMLLDHTRDFVHGPTLLGLDPTDESRTWPALFFTRWITHYCAPIFVFLAGTGAYLQLKRGKSKADLSRFLLTRGIWLVFLEFTVVRFAAFWEFNITQFFGVAQVIWALGWSMIALAALIHLPLRAIAAFGLGMMLLHNLLDGITVQPWQGPPGVPPALDKLWMILHQGGAFPIAGWPSPVIFALYPLIPWIGVMAAGFALGSIYDRSAAERKQWLLRWGVIISVGFLLIRATEIYGDTSGWETRASAAMTVVSFLNVQKYPPSLMFLMMTLGPALIALAVFERFNISQAPARRGFLVKPLVTFGRVPLFFYILQWPTAHGAGLLLSALAGKPTSVYFGTPGPGRQLPENLGFDLPVVYLAWIAGVLLLYPLCRWYAGVKARRRDWWLSYL